MFESGLAVMANLESDECCEHVRDTADPPVPVVLVPTDVAGRRRVLEAPYMGHHRYGRTLGVF